jgi:glycosyltransferase involved in cell wall biosynthesis
MLSKIGFFFKLIRQAFQVRTYAFKYIQRYGMKSTIAKAILVARAGGLAYFDTKSQIVYSSSIFQNILPNVLLVSNDLRSPSHDYRVLNISQSFWELGVPNLVVTSDDILSLESLPKSIDLIYFWRTSLDLEKCKWWNESRESGIKIAYDSDDLTFETSTYNFENVHALSLIPRNEAEFLVEVIAKRQEDQVRNSDLGIAGTPELRNAYSRLNMDSIVIPIVLPRWMQSQGEKIFKLRKFHENKAGLRIVYCSGSRSHGLDFESCADGVFNFLRKNPSATLTLQGAAPIDKKEVPHDIQGQVAFYPMVSHRELLPYLAKFHVQLAPLEMGNNFVSAKSATKFMQGGIIGVPTIASPTEPFAQAIESGINGFLASNAKEWEAALEQLADPNNLSRIAEKAYESVLTSHCLDSIKPEVLKLREISLSKEPRTPIVKEIKKVTTLTWLLPNLVSGSGGHRNVFRLANLLQGSEFNCQIYFYSESRNAKELLENITLNYGFANFSVTDQLSELRAADVLIGVHNSSIPFIKRVASSKSKIAYLVQDFEPWFNPMSDSYLDALSTYFEDDISIFTSGAWMARKIEETTGKIVPHFDFPVDKEIYRNRPEVRRDGILFFAKQDTPRRLYEVGKRLIVEICKAVPETKVEYYGAVNSNDQGLPGINVGLLPTLDDLANKYRGAKIGIAFSPTNPSLVPYEMMACGLPVIDIDIPGSPMFKYGESKLLQPSDYSLEAMCAKAVTLLGDKQSWDKTSEAGIEFIKSMPTPEEAGAVVRDFFRNL